MPLSLAGVIVRGSGGDGLRCDRARSRSARGRKAGWRARDQLRAPYREWAEGGQPAVRWCGRDRAPRVRRGSVSRRPRGPPAPCGGRRSPCSLDGTWQQSRSGSSPQAGQTSLELQAPPQPLFNPASCPRCGPAGAGGLLPCHGRAGQQTVTSLASRRRRHIALSMTAQPQITGPGLATCWRRGDVESGDRLIAGRDIQIWVTHSIPTAEVWSSVSQKQHTCRQPNRRSPV